MSVVKLEGLVALLEGFPALTGVDLAVSAGEIVFVKGPNGAGKTTLLHLCAGLIQPKEGKGQILGHDLSSERTAIRKKVGLLSHSSGLYRDLTVLENITFWTQIAGVEKSEIDSRISWALERMELDNKLQNQKARSLSVGQKRRASLAVFIVRRPDLWLMDEPHAGLDQEGRQVVDDLIKESVRAGATVIVASHDLERVLNLATRVVTLSGGAVIGVDHGGNK
ncbi:MAG: Cell division ATP-binding protein FtsE [Acidimicrobiaceae bacterium]|nr:MAG: Cell division ATP-binding protein FtsE [Acidimicrobiaceae bacterium]